MISTLETYDATLELQPKQLHVKPVTDAGRFGASLTLAKGTCIGKKTSDGLFYAYLDTATNGTQTCIGILKFSIVTDASGNIYLGTSTAASRLNPGHETAPFFIHGCFDTADLTGYDAAALADLNGRVDHTGYISF